MIRRILTLEVEVLAEEDIGDLVRLLELGYAQELGQYNYKVIGWREAVQTFIPKE